MSIHNITRVELRDDTRRAIENLEVWLRRWIDTAMTAKFGNSYLEHMVNGNRIVKKDIVEGLRDRMKKDPERYPRAIDAIHLDDAIAITCHPECYSLFKPGYEEVFPLCSAQAIKAQLDQIVPTRHKLSHANEISLPDGLLAVSTSTRIVEAIKKQFEMKNQGQEFNVPTIVKITDSLGRAWHRGQPALAQPTVYPGDSITIHAEVDPTFEPDSYQVQWTVGVGLRYSGPQVEYAFQIKDVGQLFTIRCSVIQNKDWHRYRGYDDMFKIHFKVLPPPE